MQKRFIIGVRLGSKYASVVVPGCFQINKINLNLLHFHHFLKPQQIFKCSNSVIETLEKAVKYVQSWQKTTEWLQKHSLQWIIQLSKSKSEKFLSLRIHRKISCDKVTFYLAVDWQLHSKRKKLLQMFSIPIWQLHVQNLQ